MPSLPALPKPLKLDLSRSLSLVWSSTPSFNPTHKPLVVFDSSFNPPTYAHAALCLSSLRRILQQQQHDNSHVLLLYSIKNADKSTTEKPSLEQRVSMMHAVAQDIAEADADPSQDTETPLPVSIGLVSEPYFAEKNALVKEQWPEADVSFVVGWDTLIRFFNPKYYPNNDVQAAVGPYFRQHHSKLLWFSRPTGDAAATQYEEQGYLQQPHVQEFQDGLVQIQPPQEALQVSSTRARQAVSQGGYQAQDLKHCCSPRVRQVIESEQLYL